LLARREKGGQGLTDRVVSRETFSKELAGGMGDGEGAGLSEQDVEVLLRFLEREKQAICYDERVVKFKAPFASRPEPITHQDFTIVSLKTLLSSLTSQCDTLSKRISSFTATTSAAIKSSNRISALSALRSKKLAEKNLKQRADTLAQLEEVYTKIEQAVDQVEIVRVMEASAGVLRGMNKEVGGVERVEDVIEELREEMSKVDEVGQIINEPMGAREQVDEGEIDDELEAMEREEREKQAKKVREREEREAQRTRTRLEEIARKEGLEEAQRRKQEVEELEARLRGLQKTGAGPHEAGNQLDVSTRRLSQMSLEGDGAAKTHDTDRMEGVKEAVAKEAVAEGSS
jgi:charged multivesicular body protein 7